MSTVAAVRAFNRFYTQKIGVLDEGLLGSPYTLAEARVLWELAARGAATATELRRNLDVDAGYLSRMVAGLQRRRLVTRRQARDDKRHVVLGLSARGRRVFDGLDVRSAKQIEALLRPLGRDGRRALVASMRTIESLLGGTPAADGAALVLRGPRPGELGYIVQRHGVLYAEEYGWDARFEALVAGIVARFVDRYDRRRDRCVVAERDGAVVGSVFCRQAVARVAKLRLLWSSRARAASASAAGSSTSASPSRAPPAIGGSSCGPIAYLSAARRLYERAGFVLVGEASRTRASARRSWRRPSASSSEAGGSQSGVGVVIPSWRCRSRTSRAAGCG